MERLCESVQISLNRNSIHGDTSAALPGGVRLGTPAMTTRGLGVRDFGTVAEMLDEVWDFAGRGLSVGCMGWLGRWVGVVAVR